MSEDYFLKKGMEENFGFLLKLGGIYSDWISGVYLITATIHAFLLFYTAYLKLNDIEEFTECLHFALFILIVTPNLFCGRIFKKNLEAIYIAIGNRFYNYEGTLSEKCRKKKTEILENMKKTKKRYSIIYMFMVLTSGGVVCISQPITNLIHLKEEIEFDGIQTIIPLVCWYPVDTRETFYFILCWIFQLVMVSTGLFVILQIAITFICFAEEILAQLEIISLGLKNCIARAEMLYSIKVGKKQEFDNEIFEQFLRNCLNHSVNHHRLLIKLFNDFKLIYFYVIFSLMTGSAFLLCLCGLNFMNPDVSMSSKIQFGLLMLTEVVNIFIYCYYGEFIQQKSSFINFALYDSEWFKNSKVTKTYLLMIGGKSAYPMTLSAGGFVDASLSSFSNVLSSAYSYFNLLNLLSSK